MALSKQRPQERMISLFKKKNNNYDIYISETSNTLSK